MNGLLATEAEAGRDASPGVDDLGALAALAFGGPSASVGEGRHLAFLPPDALALDLDDPEQRDFGDYELIEPIGQGGMGVVYRARQRSLDRDVALKLLSAGPWASDRFIARFRHEAQAAARLQHPNIVPIYEIGQHAELNFFSMALVRGESLAERVDRDGPLAPRAAARLVRALADALDYAHRLGTLHLDLKPANVLLDEHGEPQIADFGLSKRLDESLSSDSDEVSGTPSYMAPEQAAGDAPRIGVATDVYGLGAVLHELLAGRPPFVGASPRDTLQLVATRDVDPLPGVPADLDAICRHCLEKDPTRRYPSARALSEDLARFLDDRPVSVRPWRTRERLAHWGRREPRVAVAAAAAVLALVVGLASTTLQWRRAEQATARAEDAAGEARATLWQNRIDDAGVALRDGADVGVLPALLDNLVEQEAAGAVDEAGLTRVRLASVLAESPVLIDAIATGHYIQRAVIDAKGRWVAVTDAAGQRAQLFDIATGERRWDLALPPGAGDQLIASTDSRFLFVDETHLALPMWRRISMLLVDAERGVVMDPPPGRFPPIYRRHYTPDATHVMLVTREGAGIPRGRLVRVSDWTAIGAERELPGRVLMAPDGARFAYRETMMDDGDRPTPIEMTDARTMRVLWRYLPAEAPSSTWAFSPDGRWLAVGHADGGVMLFDVATGAKTQLASAAVSSTFDLVYGVRGQWLASTHADGTVQLWDATTGKQVAAPFRPRGADASIAAVVLDEEGRRILVSRPQTAEVWSLSTEGSAIRLFTLPRHPYRRGSISTDANIPLGLYVVGTSDGELRIWRQRVRTPLDATAPLRMHRDLVRRFDGEGVVHVDGDAVQWRSLEPGRAHGARMAFEQHVGFAEMLPGTRTIVVNAGRTVYVRDVDTGRDRYAPHVLPGTPAGVYVAPDGSGYLAAWNVFDATSGLMLRHFDATTGAATAEARTDHPSFEFQWSDDGRTLVARRLGIIHAYDARTLAHRWGPREFRTADEPTPIRGLRIGRDGETLWLVSGVGGLDGYRLHALDVETGAEHEQWRLPVWARALQPFDGGRSVAVLMSSQNELRFYRRGARFRSIALPKLDNGYASGLALSEDERRLAVGLQSGIQWLELPSGRWLSPPLEPLALDASFGSLAVSPAGDVAIMSDTRRRYWRFDLPVEGRPASQLADLFARLAPEAEDLSDTFAKPLDASVRARLRADDPGAPLAAPAEPARVAATAAQAPDLRFVDLRPHCNLQFDDSARQMPLAPRFDRMLETGTHRLLGVDFDVRCGLFARYPSRGTATVANGSRFEGIRLPREHVGALALLLAGSAPHAERGTEPYAEIEWRYRDGRTAMSSIAYARDIQPWFWHDPDGSIAKLRVAYTALGMQHNLLSGAPWLQPPAFYAVHLANPRPDAAIDSIAFQATTHPWSGPILLAASVASQR